MTDVRFRSDFDVALVDHMGDDLRICQAARVSTRGAESYSTDESAGLINFLMKNRHGTPFEHGSLTFLISAPIFVWREFMRHRIGFSYNEESGRYKQLDPVFYIPPPERPLVQVGKPGAYEFQPGVDEQVGLVPFYLEGVSRIAYDAYETLLEQGGIAREVARMCLPLNIYSSAYVTCNPRSLMSFLSLRTRNEHSKFPSFPQWEIAQVAEQMEDDFCIYFPFTWGAFDQNGRIAP